MKRSLFRPTVKTNGKKNTRDLKRGDGCNIYLRGFLQYGEVLLVLVQGTGIKKAISQILVVSRRL